MRTCGRLLPLLAVAISLAPEESAAFVAPIPHTTRSLSQTSSSSSSCLAISQDDNDDSNFSLKMETSFGADAVPESQRPVNEFLDVTSQPMFGWASLERGNKGLLARLVILYSVFFSVV